MIHQKKINLDITNIKEVPIKFIYIFYISLSGFNSLNQLENKLNNFICTKKINNPFSFDINAYMNISGKKKIKYIYENNKMYIIHDCIKFSDYFLLFILILFQKIQFIVLMELLELIVFIQKTLIEYLLVLLKKMKNLMQKLLNLI